MRTTIWDRFELDQLAIKCDIIGLVTWERIGQKLMFHVEEIRTNKWCLKQRDGCLWLTLQFNKNLFSRETVHAPSKQQDNSTSGRGARASYQTMLSEISARRSLLEPSFIYLSPGSEGEKCRPLDHMRQIPFNHSAPLIVCRISIHIHQCCNNFPHMVSLSTSRYCVY